MDLTVTVYLHIGDKLMPKTVPAMPCVGEIVEVLGLGKLTVTRVEYDAEGDPHLYLEHSSGVGGAV